MDNAQRNIDNMKLRAPFDGLVAVKDNDMNNAAWAGVVVPEFRAGDTVYPGRPGRGGAAPVGHRAHRQGERIRSRAPERRPKGRGDDSRRAGQEPAGDHQGGGGRQPPRGVVVERSDADLRRQLRRDGQRSRQSAPGPHDAGARHRRADQGGPVPAAPGALRTGWQAGRVRPSGPLVRAARGQGVASHRNAHRRDQSAGRDRSGAAESARGRKEGRGKRRTGAAKGRLGDRGISSRSRSRSSAPGFRICSSGSTTSASTSCARC